MALACILLAVGAWQFTRSKRAIDVSGWNVARLVDHLYKRKLQINTAMIAATAKSPESVYFSVRYVDRATLSKLERLPDHVGDWRGVVQCVVLTDPVLQDIEREHKESCYLNRGPFFFFGDPELLAKIDDALHGDD